MRKLHYFSFAMSSSGFPFIKLSIRKSTLYKMSVEAEASPFLFVKEFPI